MRTIYSKFILATIGIILASTLIGFFISNTYYHQHIKPLNDRKNVNVAQNLTVYIEQNEDINLDSYLESAGAIGYQIYIVKSDGEEAFYGGAFKKKNLSSDAVKKVLDGDAYHGMKEFPMETFVTGFFANELRNTVGVPFSHQGERYALFLRPDIKLLFSEIHVLLGWMILIMFIVSVIFVLAASKLLVKPIVKLTSATKEIQEGNFDITLDISRHDELGELAKSFEEMSRRLSQLDQMRTEFVSNVSHDFQSPLLNIQGYAHLLEKDHLSREEKGQYLEVIRQETNRLSLLTKQLLLLTSLEKEEHYSKPAPFNLGDQLKELVQKYRWQLDEKGIALSYHLPDVLFTGDASLLYTAWENLLTNAIKYNRQDGEIELTLREEPDFVEVAVRDTGIGMTKEEQERIFERFYRADPSRSREIEGTGLGLSIVRHIIKLHHGTITVNSQPAKGTTFTIKLKHGDGSPASNG
ncbi:HAMP domain-containing sensor histidine kinase [Bacillus sp. REN3]|uniref:sensor histidine kinase n=1 Tax=Bacillus sp. REN3 TaxID=2802440 RepID=UPI001AEE1BF1|nr:HAMP domain-containing sensor histidine kinase [Bacillus sp. REN3]